MGKITEVILGLLLSSIIILCFVLSISYVTYGDQKLLPFWYQHHPVYTPVSCQNNTTLDLLKDDAYTRGHIDGRASRLAEEGGYNPTYIGVQEGYDPSPYPQWRQYANCIARNICSEYPDRITTDNTLWPPLIASYTRIAPTKIFTEPANSTICQRVQINRIIKENKSWSNTTKTIFEHIKAGNAWQCRNSSIVTWNSTWEIDGDTAVVTLP